MAYDKDTSPVGWYLASYLLRFIELADKDRHDPEKRFLSWENTILVKAKSLDEAFAKAVKVGKGESKPYLGYPAKVRVRWEFVGLTELVPIYEPLDDGNEIAWTERRPRKLKSLRQLVKPRSFFLSRP